MIPPEKMIMMEDHDKAYHAWKERGVRAGTLVHVDAHIDFGWIPETDFDEIGAGGANISDTAAGWPLLNPFMKPRKKMINIGNYICPAMREGLVDKFYWVVPDETWRSGRGRKHIVKHLRQVLSVKQYASGELEFHKDSIRARVFGKEIIVCALDGLERISAPALLDIDVDFMLTKAIWNDLDPERVPWISPETLFEKLAPKINNIEALTIAYSVEGGFTPLRFKYLGDELRMLYEGGASEEKWKVAALKKDALLLEINKKHKEAAALYEKAITIDAGDASVYFALSLLYLNGPASDIEKAGSFYREAISRDKTYGTRFNNYGILYLQCGELKKAEAAYRQFLRIDKANAGALNGLGHVALRRKRYTDARSFFNDCLCLDGLYTEARIGLGIAYFKSGSLEESRGIFSELAKNAPGDPEALLWLGRIAEKKRERRAAIDYYKEAVLGGCEGPVIHLRLARLYVMEGFYFRALEELGRVMRLVRMR